MKDKDIRAEIERLTNLTVRYALLLESLDAPKKKKPPRFKHFQIVRCLCGRCMGPQQILRIDKKSSPVRYKVAYYNAIFGGRHWVTEGKLGFL